MKTYKRDYDQDVLRELFIGQNLSAQQIANKYNVPRYIIEGDLKKYNIHKPKELACALRVKKIDKDELYQYYIVQGHSLEACAKHFNVYSSTIKRKCLLYGFSKTSEEFNSSKVKKIDKDELYQYYIVENHSTKDTAEHFNVHERTIRRRIKQYNISKNIQQQVLCSQNSQRKKYGSLFAQSDYYKNNIVEKMVNKVKETCLKKYGASNWLLTAEGVKARSAKYFYNNIKFDSSWELALYIYAVDNNEEIIREPVKFEYLVGDDVHYYIPDFLYKGELVEIKGDHLIKNNKLNNVYKKNSFKDEAKQMCIEENHVRIMQYKDIEFALKYVKSVYGKDYLKNFKTK